MELSRAVGRAGIWMDGGCGRAAVYCRGVSHSDLGGSC